ncbi:hypothetical protein GS538_09115 [Rhodococcus hoagii]|nr:hypothetical protein [Prescottella equi]
MTMIRRSALALAATAVAAAVVTGCSTESGAPQPEPTTTAPRAQQWTPGTESGARTAPPVPSSTPPEAANVAHGDASSVAEAAMTLWFTWDTTTDSGPIDGSVRATALLTPELARSVSTEVPAQGPGGDWLGWKTQKARLVPTVTASSEPVPPQTSSRAYRSYVVDQAITLPDGSVTGHVQSIVDVILVQGANGWEVSRVNLR